MMECIVRGCIFSYGRRYNTNNNVVMYEFPRERNLRRLWLKALNIHEYELKDHWYVCEHHFSIYDYNTDGTLKYNAIPWLDIHNYSGVPMDIVGLEMGFENQAEMPTRKNSREKVHNTKLETDFTKDIALEEDATVMQKEIEVIVTLDMEENTSIRELMKNRKIEDKILKGNQNLKKILPGNGTKNQETKPSTSANSSEEPSKKSSKLTEESAKLTNNTVRTNCSAEPSKKSFKLTEESPKLTNNTVRQSKKIKKGIDHCVISSFGKFVQSRLISIKNDDIRKKAQHKIMEVMIKYEEQDIADSSD